MTEKLLSLEIISLLSQKGFTALLVGGCVRDMVLEIVPHDYDVVTNASMDEIREVIDASGHGIHINGVGAAFGILLATLGDCSVEIATFRTETGYSDNRHPDSVVFVTDDTPGENGVPACVNADSARRDLRINALYFDPVTHKIYDPQYGLEDLENNVVRFIGEPLGRITEDPLRILRYVRFVTRFESDVDSATRKVIREHSGLLKGISTERIADELTKILVLQNSGNAILLMEQLGLLEIVLPEVRKLGIGDTAHQHFGYHPEGTVLSHTVLMLNGMRNPSPELAWGVLLHDIAKPNTFEVIDGIITNRGHAAVGDVMSRKILKRLKFGNAFIDRVADIVRYHMDFSAVMCMRVSKIKRMLARPTISDEIELHRLDCRFSNGNLEGYEWMLDARERIPVSECKPEWLVTGNDLLSLGVKAGPLMGKMLAQIHEAQLDGVFATREDGLKYAVDAFELE